MFSATKWVPRGFAAEFPTKYDLDDEEMDRISKMAKLQLDDAKEALKGANEKDDDEMADDDLAEYDLEHYDDDDEENTESMGIFNNIKALAYHAPDEQDPYITLPEENDEEDREELQIFPTDNLILATRTEDDLSCLEVYVYDNETDEEENQNTPLYVHHDVMLPSFPLCVEWLGYPVGKSAESAGSVGNFAAIGMLEPQIEIWNLDIVDSVYPDAILGEKAETVSKKKKKKSVSINNESHVDAVLSLSANKLQRNILASGSADQTIKLWDLTNGKCAKSINYHEGKVSNVAFNPCEATVLLSGGYDQYARVCDIRMNNEDHKKWKSNSDIEVVRWDSNGYNFYVGTELGVIQKYDARAEGKPVWSLQAHDGEISSFDINQFDPGYMVTGSGDKTVKLWNIASEKGPSMILSRDLDVGRVFTTSFGSDPEIFGHVTVGGSTGSLKVWDTLTNRTVREIIGKRAKVEIKDRKKERIINVQDDDEEEEEEEDDKEEKN